MTTRANLAGESGASLRHAVILNFEREFAEMAKNQQVFDVEVVFRKTLWSLMNWAPSRRNEADEAHAFRSKASPYASKFQRYLSKFNPDGLKHFSDDGMLLDSTWSKLKAVRFLHLGQRAHQFMDRSGYKFDRSLSPVGRRIGAGAGYVDFRSLVLKFPTRPSQLVDIPKELETLLEQVAPVAARSLPKRLPGQNLELQSLFERDVREVFRGFGLAKRLKRACPNLTTILLTAWYGAPLMGFIAGMRSLGVEVVDVQHGQQGPDQSMYVDLPVNVDASASPIPDRFWLWGNRTKLNIGLAPAGRSLEVVGMPFNYDYELVRARLPEHAIRPSDVFVSLQKSHIDNPSVLPPELVRAIVNSRRKFTLRNHPNAGVQRLDAKKIKKKFGSRVQVADSRYPALPMVEASSLHVSSFSSTVLEAALVKVPSIVWSEAGRRSYSSLVESGIVTVDKELVTLDERSPAGGHDFSALSDYISGDKSLFERLVAGLGE